MCSCWLSGAVLSLFRACCSFAPFVAICGFSGGGSSQQAGTRKGPPLLPCCHWPASTACLVCRKGSVFNVRANYSFSSLFRRSCDEPCLMLGCSSACASFQDAWKPMQGQGTMCISFGQKPSEMFSSIEMHLLEPIRCLLPRCEFSTPFVAMRWFLDRAGMKSSCLVHVPRNTSTVAD